MQQHNHEQRSMIVESDNQWRGAARPGQYHEAISRVRNFVVTVLAIAFIILIALGIFAVRELLPLVGVLAVVSAIVLLICGVAWVVISTIRHATRADYYAIEENGAYLRNALGRVQPLAPMIAAPARVNKTTNKVQITPDIPSLFDLIEAGEIAQGKIEMVMGYDKIAMDKGILEIISGPWPGTHAIAGRGRSGKTRRVIGEIAQALIGGARVIICDPHATKPDSLARACEPLESYLTIARGEAAIVEATREFSSEMEARVSGASREVRPWLIVFDEWARLMNERNPVMPEGGRDLLADVAEHCSTEYAGYMGFCALISQVWTSEACGGTTVRRSLQAWFVHQISAEYASFFFRPAKWRNRADELKRRECIYRSVEGEVREILTMGIPDDTAQRVAVYLASQGFPAIDAPRASVPGELPAYPYSELPRLGDLRAELLLPAPGFTEASVSSPLTYVASPGSSASETGEGMKAHVEASETIEALQPRRENVTVQGESFTASAAQGEQETTYTREQETAILKAAFQLARESNGRVTRSDIKERLGWNNKMYPVLKAVCDKHEIAKQ